MRPNRREFLTASAVTGIVGAIAPAARAFTLPDPPQKARLRLSCQEGVAPGKSLAEKLDFIEALGFEGFEPGGGGLAKRVEELQTALKGRKVKISAICRDVNNPGVALMGGFWHMTWEETSDMAAFIAAGKHLHHVHVASRKDRKMPGEDEGDNYVDGFKGLKLIGYQDFVSLECGCKGDRAKAIPAAAGLLREQWQMANG